MVEIRVSRNLSGDVYYKITNKSGTNKLNAWWVKGPFGSVEGIGIITGFGRAKFKGLLWGKLRAGGADSETIVQITDQSSIATSFPKLNFRFFDQ